VNHFDLFRLGEAANWSRLQLQEAFQSGVSLVEWAERLPEPLPTSYLAIHICVLHQVCACQ
jgi:N-acetylmuramate 1-kinase